MTIWRLFPEKLGGTTTTTFIGDAGEIFYDPSSTTLRISDGSTPGGNVLLGGGGGGSEVDTLATVTARGNTTTTSITTAGITTTAASTIGGHIIPDANEQYDLGSADNKFRDLYLSSATIKMGANTIGFDGTGAQALVVNGEPINNVINNSTIVQNIIDGSGWQLMGPYVNEAAAATAGVQVGQAYYDNGGTVRVRLV